MPIVTFNLAEDGLTDAISDQLLQASAQLYADLLESPIERVRAIINTYPAKRSMVGGKVLVDGDKGAPFFEYFVLAGRPQSQIEALMQGFTDLLVNILAVDRSVVRGRCIRVNPDDWGISGKLASEIRSKEIEARKLAENS